MFKKKYFFIFILGLTVIAILIVAKWLSLNRGYLKSPPEISVISAPAENLSIGELSFPDNNLDTSDWQTYRDDEFGFEVKYPKDWGIGYPARGDERDATYRDTIELLPPGHTARGGYTTGFTIKIFKKSFNKTKWETLIHSYYRPDFLNQFNVKNISFTLKGLSGTHVALDRNDVQIAGFNKYYAIGNDSFSYVIIYRKYGREAVFQKILLSFQPIPIGRPIDLESLPLKELSFPNNTIDTSNWQTYRNEKFGFEVKYPQGWKVKFLSEGANPNSFNPDIATLLLFPKIDSGTFLYIYDRSLVQRAKELARRDWFVKERIKINNAEGVSFASKDEDGNWLPSESYSIGRAGFSFDFVDIDFTEIFQKILLSFKFIQ